MRIATIVLIGHLLLGSFPAWASVDFSFQVQSDESPATLMILADCHTDAEIGAQSIDKGAAEHTAKGTDIECAQHCLALTALPIETNHPNIPRATFSKAISPEHMHLDPSIVQLWRPPNQFS